MADTRLQPESLDRPHRSFAARAIRTLSPLIILAWVALTLVLTLGVPWLEVVGREHAVPMAPQDAPSVLAMQRMGGAFQEFDSDSFAMLVMEGQHELGEDAHTYYDRLISTLRADSQHVRHVQDLWSDRLTQPARRARTVKRYTFS